MRRAIALATSLLLAAGAAIAPVGGVALATEPPVTVGEVCIQQNGVYLASVRTQTYEPGTMRTETPERIMAIGQTFCVPYSQTDTDMFVYVNVVMGHSKNCKVILHGRRGVLNVVTTGTSLNVNLACP